MNPYIIKLQIIAGKKKRHIIGLMSGTSLDGLDIAHCTIEGSGKKQKLTWSILLLYHTMYFLKNR